MKTRNFTLIELLVCVAIIAILGGMILGTGILGGCQTGGWGPEKEWTIVVKDKYVDTESKGKGSNNSHYMVATDVGVFEVNNGYKLGVWNADEIYGKLDRNCKYRIKTKGIQKVSWYIQEYPYIIAILEGPIKDPVAEPVVSNKAPKNFDNMTMKEVQEWAKKNGVEVSIKPSGSNAVIEK